MRVSFPLGLETRQERNHLECLAEACPITIRSASHYLFVR